MPLLYSVISRGATVLAKNASCAGNFEEVTEQILAKIPPTDGKMTYSQGPYLFHYICEDSIIYMCITDDVSFILCATLYYTFAFTSIYIIQLIMLHYIMSCYD